MNMVKWFTYILILGFLVVLSPRNIWHDCDHEHEHSISDLTESHFSEQDCFVCDFELSTAHQPLFFSITFPIAHFHELVVSDQALFVEGEFLPFSHRGPPSRLA
jgi:hypothetical protein